MPLLARLLLTLTGAALGILAVPPVHWHPLALVAPLPFLLALRGAGPRTSLLLGLSYGLALYAGTLNWFVAVFGTVPMAIALFFILALFTTLFAMGFQVLQQARLSAAWLGVAAAVFWTGLEYFRGEWFTLRFTWITPGTSLPPNWLSPVVGVYGVSLLVVLAAAWIATGWARRLPGLILLGIVALAAYVPRPAPPAPTLRVAAVQAEGLDFNNLLALSARFDGSVDAFVWPEYSLDFDLRTEPEKLARVRSLLRKRDAGLLVAGSLTDYADGELRGKWSNTAILVGRDAILGHHHKNRPVHFFNDGVPGTEARAWPTPVGRVATPICFDNDYAQVPREAVARGAELILAPSMDATSWTARQHLQHAELFRHRAAENGRWVVVASSSGVTQAIDPNGTRRASLPLFDPGVMIAEVGLASHRTIFNRVGWLLGPGCTVLAAGILFWGIFRQQLERRRKPS